MNRNRQLPPYHYLNRLDKRKKDWWSYLWLRDTSFERLNPEE